MKRKKRILVDRYIIGAPTLSDIKKIYEDIQQTVANQFGDEAVNEIQDLTTHWAFKEFRWNKPTEPLKLVCFLEFQDNGTFRIVDFETELMISLGTNIIDKETGRLKKEFKTERGFRIPRYMGGHYDYVFHHQDFQI